MKASEFDSRLRDIVDAEDVLVDPEQWNRLAATLPGAKVRISRRLVNWMRAVGWAAVALFALAGGYYWYSDSPVAPAPGALTRQQPAAPIQSGEPAMPASPVAPGLENQPQVAPDLAAVIARSQPSGPMSSLPLSPDVRTVSPLAAIPGSVSETPATPSAPQTPTLPAASPAPRPAAPATMAAGGLSEPFVPIMDAPGRERKRGGTAIGVAGGYQYGSRNGGYAVGVSVRQQLGAKVFVDGDLAYVGSSRPTSTSRMDASTFSRLASPEADNAGGMGRQPLPATAAASLAYLQLAPAVSYQVLPALSVGAGPDVQRIISQAPSTNDNLFVSYDQESAPEYIPTIDWGLTGKAEYSIGQRLRAGLQYRRGLNNALRSEPGVTYIERHYMQVQLKYFLVK